MWTWRSPPYQPRAAVSYSRAGSRATSAAAPAAGVRVVSAVANSMPRVQVTLRGTAGTSSSRSWPWNRGRSWRSHLGGNPSGNQAPPRSSVTDQRLGAAARSRSRARAAGWAAGAAAPPTPSGPAPVTVRVTSSTPPAGTGVGTPSTSTRVGSSRWLSSSTATSTPPPSRT
jgi:hypothetical protein